MVLGHTSSCLPFWYSDAASQCPFGKALPGDVTLPKDPSWVQTLAVAYGYAPYLVALWLFGDLCLRRGSRQMAIVFFIGFTVMVNEACVKPFVAQPRPGATGLLYDDAGKQVGSCLLTCGMPSSHATLSVGLLVLLFLDSISRTIPASAAVGGQVFAPDSQLMTPTQLASTTFCWGAVLLPVPVMRVTTFDHSVDQVIFGSVLGVAYALAWFGAMSLLAAKFQGYLGLPFCGGLCHHNLARVELRAKDTSQGCDRGAEIEAGNGGADAKGGHGEPTGSIPGQDQE